MPAYKTLSIKQWNIPLYFSFKVKYKCLFCIYLFILESAFISNTIADISPRVYIQSFTLKIHKLSIVWCQKKLSYVEHWYQNMNETRVNSVGKKRGVNGDGRFMFFVLSHHFISMPFYGSCCTCIFFHIVTWNGKFLNIST